MIISIFCLTEKSLLNNFTFVIEICFITYFLMQISQIWHTVPKSFPIKKSNKQHSHKCLCSAESFHRLNVLTNQRPTCLASTSRVTKKMNRATEPIVFKSSRTPGLARAKEENTLRIRSERGKQRIFGKRVQ